MVKVLSRIEWFDPKTRDFIRLVSYDDTKSLIVNLLTKSSLSPIEKKRTREDVFKRSGSKTLWNAIILFLKDHNLLQE
jgi:hypothetical protein